MCSCVVYERASWQERTLVIPSLLSLGRNLFDAEFQTKLHTCLFFYFINEKWQWRLFNLHLCINVWLWLQDQNMLVSLNYVINKCVSLNIRLNIKPWMQCELQILSTGVVWQMLNNVGIYNSMVHWMFMILNSCVRSKHQSRYFILMTALANTFSPWVEVDVSFHWLRFVCCLYEHENFSSSRGRVGLDMIKSWIWTSWAQDFFLINWEMSHSQMVSYAAPHDKHSQVCQRSSGSFMLAANWPLMLPLWINPV